MTVIRHENAIELVPESEYERECLKLISGKSVSANWTDRWEQNGNMRIDIPQYDYGR